MTTPVFYGFETKELTFYKDKNVAVGKAVGAGALKKATMFLALVAFMPEI
mgnify:CR=1 FL=1